MSMKIPISKPYFGDEERAAIVEPLATGWVVQGPKVAEFERLFGLYTGAANSVATSSCTTALHLSLVALGVGPGDEVILPSFTWVATANAVEMVGARPVFVDIDLGTFNVDPDRVEAAVTARTRAIVPVSLFGVSADIDPVMQIAARHGLKVVEDAACAVGAWYHGRHAGTVADVAASASIPAKRSRPGRGAWSRPRTWALPSPSGRCATTERRAVTSHVTSASTATCCPSSTASATTTG